MNNNRNNNRRRGRGNNNRNQGGGGNALNRIDSRARGNAPQLLDKYKKLAQDAQHHGDRVQAEYYLQFADHYQRVIADNKARQDEARAKRNEERGDSGEGQDGREDGRQDSREDTRGRRPRNRNDRNDNRGENRRDDRSEGRGADQQEGEIGSEGDAVEISGDASEGEVAEKPAKPRRARAPRAKKEGGAEPKPRAARAPRKKPVKADDGLDLGVLPPAISSDNAEAAE